MSPRSPRPPRALSLGISALLVTTGLAAWAGPTATAATAVTATRAHAAPTVRVHIDNHRRIHMPLRLRPGVHRFQVRSAKQASYQLIRAHGHYTKRMLAHDVNAGLNSNDSSSPAGLRALRRFERHVVLLGGVPSRAGEAGVMWARLHRGRYWAADTDASHQLARKILTFRVRGAETRGRMPAAHTIKAVHETDWAARPKVIPRAGVLRFSNASEDNHFIAMAPIADGKTMKDVRRWFHKAAKGEDPGAPPFDMSAPSLDTGVLSPGHVAEQRYRMPAGRYVVTCWWPDSEMGGMPHAFMGMYRKIVLR
jgi:hypothetical protein